MAGELWLSEFRIAKETVYGTMPGGGPTRKMYFRSEDSALSPQSESRIHHFATGRRDNVLAITRGAQMPGGTVSLPISAVECMELFNLTIGAPVTTTPGGGTTTRLHTYKPGSALPESGALQWHDGARPWQMTGVYGNALRIQGAAGGDNILTCELFGKTFTQTALSGTVSDRTPDFDEGWEAKLYLDNLGATPGTTPIANTLINWNISFGNQLGRKFTADNVNAMNKAVVGELVASVEAVFEASEAISLTEFNHWLTDDVAGRLLRFEFGNNDILEGALKRFMTIDVPGKWAAFDLGQTDAGTRAYGVRLDYLYDATLGAGFQARLQNARTAAFA